MTKQLYRLMASAALMESKDRLRFVTLTVPEKFLPLRIVAFRWRGFSNSRWWRTLKNGRDYIVVFEPHPGGHGWHIHILTNYYIPWQELQSYANLYGFGHTDICACDPSIALYLAKYLVKSHRLIRHSSERGVRIVNVSRRLLALRDVLITSSSTDFIRANWESIKLPPLSRVKALYYLWVYRWSRVCLSKDIEPYI